jgi:phage terminase large subunit-like protein
LSNEAVIREINLKKEQVVRLKNARLSNLYKAMYPWQRKFNAATAANEVCMLLAGNQVGKCVTKQTLIDLPDGSQITAGEIYERGVSFKVLAWDKDSNKVVEAVAVAPIKKPPEPCVRLYLENGRWFECALGHRVLTSCGYSFVSSILEYLPCLPQTNSELYPSIRVSDDLRCRETFPNYQDGYFSYSRPCDEQPHLWSDSDLISPPLLGGVRQLFSAWCKEDGQENIYTNIRLQGRALLSSLDVCLQNVAHFFGFSVQAVYTSSLQSCGYKRNVQHTLAESKPQLQLSDEVRQSQSYTLVSPFKEGNQIISYQLIGCKDVYDFCVPVYENYITSGVIHHNSRTGCIIDAYHLLGDYPEDWDGHKYDFPPLIWCLGYSGEKTRDLLQKKIVGDLDASKKELTGGFIPKNRILNYKSMQGTTGAVREATIQHSSGGVAVVQFWSYSQGHHALMGDVVDFFHIDEEPEDHEIYPQVLTRTINGDRGRGGRGILTFTPENGKTELVVQFMDEIQDGMYLQRATWDECPHILPEQAEKILSKFPPYQRNMRSKGDPLMGEGLIYAHSEDSITCKRFEVPDHWWLINGMDFGWKHPQAHVQLAIDPETSTVYVMQAWKASEKQPYEAWEAIKTWAKLVPTAWPHDGAQHKIQSGNKDAVEQKTIYEEQGWNMLDEHAQWASGDNGVDLGLMELNKLMALGHFKVCSDLFDALEELREYHTKLKANGLSEIVKVKDDILDAIRYAFMMARHAEQKHFIYNPQTQDDYDEYKPTSAMGY